MLGTSPSGLNQIESKRLAEAPCKRRELHVLPSVVVEVVVRLCVRDTRIYPIGG
jgi:hypothetical protein